MVKFLPLMLLVIQTTWLAITGLREVYREIVINKLKPFKHKPDNIEDCQMEADQIPEEDLDGEGVKPIVEPQDSKAREGFVQCVEIQPTVEETEDLKVR